MVEVRQRGSKENGFPQPPTTEYDMSKEEDVGHTHLTNGRLDFEIPSWPDGY